MLGDFLTVCMSPEVCKSIFNEIQWNRSLASGDILLHRRQLERRSVSPDTDSSVIAPRDPRNLAKRARYIRKSKKNRHGRRSGPLWVTYRKCDQKSPPQLSLWVHHLRSARADRPPVAWTVGPCRQHSRLSSQFELDGADVFEVRAPPNKVVEFVDVLPDRRDGCGSRRVALVVDELCSARGHPLSCRSTSRRFVAILSPPQRIRRSPATRSDPGRGRKVRAPQGRVPGNSRWGWPRGKCNREQTAAPRPHDEASPPPTRAPRGKGETVG